MAEMVKSRLDRKYFTCYNMGTVTNRTIEMTDPKLIFRVYLTADPSQYVLVTSTQSRRRQTLQKIRGDIIYQKFPRWAPFQGQIDGEGWRWCFVNDRGQRVDLDGNLHPDQTVIV